MSTDNEHNVTGSGTAQAAVNGKPANLRVWSHDPGLDEITEFIAAMPQAPDVDASASRTTRMTPEDTVIACDRYLSALEAMRRRIEAKAPLPDDIADGLEGALARGMALLEEAERAQEAASAGLAETREKVRAFDRAFPSADDEPGRFSPRRLGNLGEKLVVFGVGACEAAMSYFGLSLAAPKTELTSTDPIQQFLGAHGPELMAVGVGTLSALVTVRVAKELALAMAAKHTVEHNEGGM